MKVIKNLIFFLIIFPLLACNFRNESKLQGYVEADLIYMASPYSGKLLTRDVDRGNFVKRGQLLFRLDPEPELSQLASAKANYEQANASLKNLEKGQRSTITRGIEAQINQAIADLKLATVRLQRNKQLYQANAVSKDTLDAAQAEFDARNAALNKLQSDLAEARLGARTDVIIAQESTALAALNQVKQLEWTLSQKALVAPEGGLIDNTYFEAGEFVPQTKPVMSLLTPSRMHFIFFIPEPLLSKVKVGQKVRIGCDGCAKDYVATLNFISPTVEFTPPVVFSREENYKYVYRVRAVPELKEAFNFQPGQPVYVYINK